MSQNKEEITYRKKDIKHVVSWNSPHFHIYIYPLVTICVTVYFVILRHHSNVGLWSLQMKNSVVGRHGNCITALKKWHLWQVNNFRLSHPKHLIYQDERRCIKWTSLHSKVDKPTRGISNLVLAFEGSCHRYAKNHEDPINIWNIYLVGIILWCMYNFDSGKTAKCHCLLD